MAEGKMNANILKCMNEMNALAIILALTTSTYVHGFYLEKKVQLGKELRWFISMTLKKNKIPPNIILYDLGHFLSLYKVLPIKLISIWISLTILLFNLPVHNSASYSIIMLEWFTGSVSNPLFLSCETFKRNVSICRHQMFWHKEKQYVNFNPC